MKVLSLEVSMDGIEINEKDKDRKTVEFVTNAIKNIMLGWGNQHKGFDEESRRKYYKIIDVLDEAVKTDAKSIELEDDWMGFIRQCKREINMLPDNFIRRVEKLIDDVKDR